MPCVAYILVAAGGSRVRAYRAGKRGYSRTTATEAAFTSAALWCRRRNRRDRSNLQGHPHLHVEGVVIRAHAFFVPVQQASRFQGLNVFMHAPIVAAESVGQPETKIGPLCRELGITRQTLYWHVAPDGSLREHGTKLLGRRR